MASAKRPLAAVLILILACAFLSGCATMRYPGRYKVGGAEFADFKDLDDDHALKAVALIYNVRRQCWEDGAARSIALEEYLKLLARRNSAYLKNSGIFATQYEKANIASWTDDELIRLYDCLTPKANAYYEGGERELSEPDNAQRIVYVTAVNAVLRELKKRDLTQKAMQVAGQVVSAALMVAMAMI